jgi:hemerythrin
MEMFFEWKDEYRMEIDEVDKQHKKLFDLGRKVSNLIQNKDISNQVNAIGEILNELIAYTQEHFNQEEAFMMKQQYIDLATHRMEHDFLRKKLLYIDNMDLSSHDTIVKLVSFLSDWISEHIIISDMKFKKYLLSQEKHSVV